MEDPADTGPEAEWSIQEQEYSSKENNGKLKWMLDKGLTVGKKILVTGFVISSATVVLPPLAVISIIGFAFSVPYGLFLASYACTNTLMSKLLLEPEPEPPRYLLEYGTVSSTDEEVEIDGNGEGGEDMGLNGYKEEEEIWEDMRKSDKMRIELVANDESNANGEQELLVNDGKLSIVEETGYEVDIELKIGGLGEKDEQHKQPVVDEVMKTVVVDIKREEEIMRETTGLLEKFRDGEENNRSVEKPFGGAEEGDLRVDSQIEVMRMPFETWNDYDNVEREKPLMEIEPKIDENDDDREVAEAVYVQNVDVVPKEMEPKPEEGDLAATKESDEVLEAEKSTSEMSGMTDVGGNMVEEQKCKASQQEGRANDNVTKDAQQDSQLSRTKVIVISTNADREIACESDNVAAHQYSDADINTGGDVASTKNKQLSSPAVLESADLMDLPVSAGDHDHNDTGISSQESICMDSSKVNLCEEKILEKIEAMRVIVGYKAARQATCLEELKALYIFTGVEPPASFKDPSDLMEVNDKLRFLMSIVGVK